MVKAARREVRGLFNAIINQKEKDMKKSFELLKMQLMMQVRRKSVKVIDRHGIERVWAICSSRCMGCCYHGLHKAQFMFAPIKTHVNYKIRSSEAKTDSGKVRCLLSY